MKPLLLQAFEGTQKSVPVWFMRQAGRYLPDYQALKKQFSLSELFQTPDLAARVTLQPVEILDVDAAILFADILTLPIAMGADIHFDQLRGPIVKPLKDFRLKETYDFTVLDETIRLVKQDLCNDKALIGFAGSPFTVLTYLIEGGSAINFTRTMRLLQEDPGNYHSLMSLLTRNTIAYLQSQQKAGIDVFQIFDTWAGILPTKVYQDNVMPYVQEIFATVRMPSIYYVRQCSHLLPLMAQSGADILSVCHTVDLADLRTLQLAKSGIQGNLYNGLLYAEEDVLRQEVERILRAATAYERYVFNLNHGVFPDIEVEKLKKIVQWVHEFSWSNQVVKI